VLALIERDGTLLLERRSDCGRWRLNGVGVDVNPSKMLCGASRQGSSWRPTNCTAFSLTRIVRYPDGNVVLLLSFVYKTEVEGFETLQRSEESEELWFFDPEELPELDVIETARPILDSYLSVERYPA
jgi:hypothetical protein